MQLFQPNIPLSWKTLTNHSSVFKDFLHSYEQSYSLNFCLSFALRCIFIHFIYYTIYILLHRMWMLAFCLKRHFNLRVYRFYNKIKQKRNRIFFCVAREIYFYLSKMSNKNHSQLSTYKRLNVKLLLFMKLTVSL